MSRVPRSSRARQRGVAAVFAAVSLVALLSAVALGIDIGRLYLAQRDLQRMADLAAIDAARVAGGCLAGPGSRASAPGEALASLARNGMPGDVTPATFIGKRIRSNSLYDFEAVADDQPWDSVQVQLAQPTPARILPLFTGAETRTLRARAAAFSGVALFFDSIPSAGYAEDPRRLAQTLGPQLGSSGSVPVFAPGGANATTSATVRVGDLIDASESAGVDGSELDDTQTAQGLLSRLAALLRASGDTGSAAVTQAFADATDAGRMLIPREVLGIPAGTPRALYEDAVVRVDGLLSAVASTLGQGLAVPGMVQLPPAVCGLTARLGVPLCDVTTTTTVNTPGSGGLVTSGVDTRTSTDGGVGVGSVGGVLQFQITVVEPVSGQSFVLPVTVRQQAVTGTPGGYSCARRGVGFAEAHLLTEGGAVTVGLGDASAGALPLLNLTLAGQAVKVNLNATPVSVGGGRDDLCFSGPTFPTSVQCDGSPAVAGRVEAADISAAISGLNSQLSVQVDAAGLPLGLGVEPLLAPVLDSLKRLLPGVLDALASQALPVLRSSNLPAGGVPFSLTSFSAPAPTVYAR